MNNSKAAASLLAIMINNLINQFESFSSDAVKEFGEYGVTAKITTPNQDVYRITCEWFIDERNHGN